MGKMLVKNVMVFGYNVEGMQKGAEELGKREVFDNLTPEQMSKLVAHALGYVDFSDPSIMEECLAEALAE